MLIVMPHDQIPPPSKGKIYKPMDYKEAEATLKKKKPVFLSFQDQFHRVHDFLTATPEIIQVRDSALNTHTIRPKFEVYHFATEVCATCHGSRVRPMCITYEDTSQQMILYKCVNCKDSDYPESEAGGNK